MEVSSLLKTYGRVKTYEPRKKIISIPHSEASRAFDALFAKNRSLCSTSLIDKSNKPSKRNQRKNKNLIKELPKQPTVLNDSFDIKINNTFDNLFDGPIYNSVRYTELSEISQIISDGSYNTSNSSEKDKCPKNAKTKKEKKLAIKKSGRIQKRVRNAKKQIINSFVTTLNNSEVPNKPGRKIKETVKQKKSARQKSKISPEYHKHKYLEETIDHSLIIEVESRNKYDNVKQNIPSVKENFNTTPICRIERSLEKFKTYDNNSIYHISDSYIENKTSDKIIQKSLKPKIHTEKAQENKLPEPRLLNIDDSVINISDSQCKFYLDSKNASSSLFVPNEFSFNKFPTSLKCSTPLTYRGINNSNGLENVSSISLHKIKDNVENTSASLFSDNSTIVKLKPARRNSLRKELLVDFVGFKHMNKDISEQSPEKIDTKFIQKAVVVLEKISMQPKKMHLEPIVKLERLILDDKNSAIVNRTPNVSPVLQKRKQLRICEEIKVLNDGVNQYRLADQDCSREVSINVDLEEFESFVKRNSDMSISSLSDVEFVSEEKLDLERVDISKRRVTIKPGKQYRRSMLLVKKDHSLINNLSIKPPVQRGRKCKTSICKTSADQYYVEPKRCTLYNVQNRPNYRQSIKIVKLPNEEKRTTVNRKKSGYVSTLADDTVLEDFSKLSLVVDEERDKTAKEIVLKYCNQTEPQLFNECYSERSLKKCRKIGEGVYGEVFMYKNSEDKCVVMKIIPIEGEQLVNGEHQKKYEEIISEIIISTELSNLRTNVSYRCDGFAEVLKVSLVCGKYPQQLIDLWDLFDEDRGSENDSPVLFHDDQLYIVLELANGGQDLEAYNFGNAEMAYSLFVQIACTMAVAEAALQFEHRDLHWGNVLISPTDKTTLTFCLNGREFEIPTKGIKLTIIDFTLSRMTAENCCIYNDLAMDPDLFTATGDYQFEVYRLMKKRVDDDWQKFEPYTNVLWLDYVLDKMISHLRYLRVNSKTHKTHIRKLSNIKKKVLNYNSVIQFINSDVFSNVFL